MEHDITILQLPDIASYSSISSLSLTPFPSLRTYIRDFFALFYKIIKDITCRNEYYDYICNMIKVKEIYKYHRKMGVNFKRCFTKEFYFFGILMWRISN